MESAFSHYRVPNSPQQRQRMDVARQRVISGINLAARRSVRDIARVTRQELRAEGLPCDPWLDATIAGRSGNHTADFMVRFAQVLHNAGRKPREVRARLVALAMRIADAAHLTQRPI